ncbi:MAG: transcription antitermination factor NusB [Candidatus Eremiobacteraeota bacterium]|nr:transcription antitermination factor NusB [Candidatus Eremiobacteraeota bacterium]MBV8281933.1 transcription antitermination factor NusB [Candidatus Eremiobacteraeota bacterium]
MAKERREHRIALEVLYAVDIGKAPIDEALRQAREGIGVFGRGDEAAGEDPYEAVLPAMDARADAPRATDWVLVEQLVRGTIARKDELQEQIAPLLERWTIERLSGVDRLVLDLAAWELRYRPNAQTTEIINHAVELARRLSTEQSGAFVNGVLDALAKTPPPGVKA